MTLLYAPLPPAPFRLRPKENPAAGTDGAFAESDGRGSGGLVGRPKPLVSRHPDQVQWRFDLRLIFPPRYSVVGLWIMQTSREECRGDAFCCSPAFSSNRTRQPRKVRFGRCVWLERIAVGVTNGCRRSPPTNTVQMPATLRTSSMTSFASFRLTPAACR
jgi:hypothetical protein